MKSIVPCGLVIASLALSGGAMATEAHAKTAKPVHVITHVVRRHAAPAQQPDFVAQFFQGLFGGGCAGAKFHAESTANSTATPDWVDVPRADNSGSSQYRRAGQRLDAEVQAIQQMNDQRTR